MAGETCSIATTMRIGGGGGEIYARYRNLLRVEFSIFEDKGVGLLGARWRVSVMISSLVSPQPCKETGGGGESEDEEEGEFTSRRLLS